MERNTTQTKITVTTTSRHDLTGCCSRTVKLDDLQADLRTELLKNIRLSAITPETPVSVLRNRQKDYGNYEYIMDVVLYS